MSAPDNSNSKAPPSLLADAAKGAQANHARILANLEGRVAAQPVPANAGSAAQLAAAAGAARQDAASAPHAATIITVDNSDADTKAAMLAGASKVELAHATKHAETKKVASKDDSDADLLAALVARTPPYSAKKPAVPATEPGAKAHQASSLAEQVKDCGTRGFFEDQLCRWRVCDGHWGKDPACPNAAQAKQP
ncbi:MAG TPA: hypothetical protein VKS80_13915 [Trinickia sp.]|nr:hypothetical protein [Trinickia sp.]